jgi:A/G-specific adenine glycosylase
MRKKRKIIPCLSKDACGNSSYMQSLSALVKWYQKHQRPLPWRRYKRQKNQRMYEVWISEIMLQQTQVSTVLPYYEAFLARFPTVSDLAAAPLDEVLRLWSGLGYYRRARFLHEGAKQVATSFPTDREGWLAIPGVGPYTVGAILSLALEEPEPILDGNIERVLSRVYALNRDEKGWKRRLWDEAKKNVLLGMQQGFSPRDTNQAFMELGATLCLALHPLCKKCPLGKSCKGQKQVDHFPGTKKRPQILVLKERCLAHLHPMKEILVWLVQPKETRWRKGLWDLPSTSKETDTFVQTTSRVTHHHIHRTTFLTFEKPRGPGAWVSAKAPESTHPVSGACKKTLQAILKVL